MTRSAAHQMRQLYREVPQLLECWATPPTVCDTVERFGTVFARAAARLCPNRHTEAGCRLQSTKPALLPLARITEPTRDRTAEGRHRLRRRRSAERSRQVRWL